jgi:uncharacterized protein DUF1236
MLKITVGAAGPGGSAGGAVLELGGPPSYGVDPVRPAEGKVKAPGNIPATVGADVPPATELYFLPDGALATAPEAKGIKYTVAQNRVVLVDPTTMRVVDVNPRH